MSKIIIKESTLKKIIRRSLNEGGPEGPEMPEIPPQEYLNLLAVNDDNKEGGEDEIGSNQLTEEGRRNLIKKLLRSLITEGISNSALIFSAHPGNVPATDFFPKIIPNQYKRTYEPGGKWWQNSCASKMSIAMAISGMPVTGQYKTEVEYKGLPAGTPFNPSSKAFKDIFTAKFGQPTITFKTGNVGFYEIPNEIKGRKGVFVLLTNAWTDAAGHVDAFDGKKSASGHEYWDQEGTCYFWGEPTDLEVNASKCGWGNDTEGYKLSGWRCYDVELLAKKSCPILNARKCGYGDDVKSYRLSGWKCKTKW